MAKIIKSAYMKTLKGLIKFWSKIIALLFGMMGFSGCPGAVYGPPPGEAHADYTINGKVTALASSNAIEYIKITVVGEYDSTLAVTRTDNSGNYSAFFQTLGAVDMEVIVKAEDDDGPANGGPYSANPVTVIIQESDFIDDTPDDDWDQGHGIKNDVDIKMTE